MKTNKVKRIVVIGVLLILPNLTNVLQAQSNKKSELNFGYGLITTNDWNFSFAPTSITVLDNQVEREASSINEKGFGGFFIGYKFEVTRRLMLGGIIMYQKKAEDLLFADRSVNFKRQFYTLAVELDYRYVNKELVKLYSGIGLGYTVINESFSGDTTNFRLIDSNEPGYFNLHVNAIGVRVGKALAGFAEIGFGYKGLLNFGISYQF